MSKTRAILKSKELQGLAGVAAILSSLFAAHTFFWAEATSPSSEIKTNESVISKEVDGILFSVDKCTYTGSFLTCAFTGKSSNDLDFALDDATIYDSNGNRYGTSRKNLGNLRAIPLYQIRSKLIDGIATPIVFEFDNVTPRPSQIGLITFRFRSGPRTYEVSFKNINVTTN